MVVLFNKPFNVLSQFSSQGTTSTLADFINIPDIYPAGRLDKDSEGLLILTDDGKYQAKLSHPRFKQEKTYWAQIENEISEEGLQALRDGLELKDGRTLPAKARVISPPKVWPRTPPIRERKNIPTQWIELCIKEGRNRQVRRMTAAVGHPTLRLIRVSVGKWKLGNLAPGEWTKVM